MATKKATPAQLAARKLFAERAKAGLLTKKPKASRDYARDAAVDRAEAALRIAKKTAKRKTNPLDPTPYGVSWKSALTGSRNTSYHKTKSAAMKEAYELYKEGAKNIDAFKYSENIGAISFDWRIQKRLKNPTEKRTQQRKTAPNAVVKNPIKKKIATDPEKALYKFEVQFKEGKNWKSQAAFANLEKAKDYAYALAINNKNKTIRVKVYTGGE